MLASPTSPQRQHVDILALLQRLDDQPDTVRFFGSDDGAEVFGNCAMRVCELIFRTESSLKRCFDGKTPYLTLTAGQLSLALRELILGSDATCYVELWSKPSGAWRCERKASPGNLDAIEDLLLRDDSDISSTAVSTPTMAGLIVKPGDAGFLVTIVYINTGDCAIGHCQFADNELLLNTEVTLAQLACRQAIYPATGTPDKLVEMLNLCGILATPLPSKTFDPDVGSFDLSRLVKPDISLEASMVDPTVHAVAAALFSYLQVFRLQSNLESFELISYDSKCYMRLDESALRGLHVFSSASAVSMPQQQKNGAKCSSLHAYLSQHCRTSQGVRLLSQWLRQPLLDVSVVNKRLDIVECYALNVDCRHQLREQVLKGMHDLARINRKLQRDRASLQDLAVLFDVLTKCGLLQDILLMITTAPASLTELVVCPLKELLAECEPLKTLLKESLDFEAMLRHEYLVKSSFDPSLGELANMKLKLLASLEEEAERVSHQAGLEFGKKLKLECNPDTYGHYLRVSRLDGKSLESLRGDGYEDLAVLKSGILFQTTPIRHLSEQYATLHAQYLTRQASIVKELRQNVGRHRAVLERLNIVVAMIDVYCALAQSALSAPMRPWVRPTFSSDRLLIRNGRHPLLEAKMAEEGNVDRLVCSDCDLSGESRFGVITGPNMGGKSTFLRQTGLIALMAQIGSFVPADSAELPVFDAIMLRVGAGDDLFKGISTFLAEMLQVSSILSGMTDSSLVLVDELGRGTSCEEGAAVAKAIAEYIVQRCRAKCLFATHFHELAEGLVAGMHCLHVDLEHRVRSGASEGRSLGIDLAERMGFPPSFINTATAFYQQLSR